MKKIIFLCLLFASTFLSAKTIFLTFNQEAKEAIKACAEENNCNTCMDIVYETIPGFKQVLADLNPHDILLTFHNETAYEWYITLRTTKSGLRESEFANIGNLKLINGKKAICHYEYVDGMRWIFEDDEINTNNSTWLKTGIIATGLSFLAIAGFGAYKYFNKEKKNNNNNLIS